MLILGSTTDHSFLRRDVETHTSYQPHNFHTTGVNVLKSWCKWRARTHTHDTEQNWIKSYFLYIL